MKRRTCWLLVILAMVGALVGSAAAAPAKHARTLTSISVSYDNAAGNFLPLWVAAKQGFFQQNGLDVNLVQNANGAALIVSNNVQFALGGGSNFIAARAHGADLELLGALENHFAAVCIARPNISTVKDLAGKKLGLSSPGALVDLEGQVMLKAFGLSPSTVQIVYISSLTARNAALLSGSIDALVGSPNVTLIQQGMKQIYDLDSFYYLSVAISASKGYADANPTVVTAFLKSMIQAIQWLNNSANEEQAMVYDSQLTGQTNSAQTSNDVEHYRATFDPRLHISAAALGNTVRWVSQTGGGFVAPKDMIDTHFVDKLISSGWMDRNVPPPKIAATLNGLSFSLKDSNGNPVTRLTPGRYEFDISNKSKQALVFTGPYNFQRVVSPKSGARWVVNLVRGAYHLGTRGTKGKTVQVS